MRLLSYETEAGPAGGVQIGDEVVALDALGAPAWTVRGLLEALDGEQLSELAARAESEAGRVALADVRLTAPVPDAEKLICIGLNYRDHAEGTGQEIPSRPMW